MVGVWTYVEGGGEGPGFAAGGELEGSGVSEAKVTPRFSS